VTDSTEIVATRDLAVLPELLQLENRSFRGFHAAHRFDESQFSYYLGNDRAIVLVATRSRHLVGYVLGIAQRGSRRHIARVYSIAVSRDCRRQRIGTRLIREFVTSARQMGCLAVTLEVADRNRPALALFEGAGFRRRSRLPDYYGPGADGVRMRLKLGGS